MSISKINLKNDLGTIIKHYFKVLESLSPSLDYYSQIKNKNDINNLCLLYYNLINRLVEPRPRAVYKSNIFYCPSKFINVLENIKEKIENGEDITPYLSRGVQWVDDKNLNRNSHRDALLVVWGIHHIHLRAQIESNGFVKRSGPILFVKFENDNAYFILIKRHNGKGRRRYDPWNNQFLINIIHENWVKSIANHESKMEIIRATDDEIKQWKKGNINVPATSKDGTTYLNLGGGVALSGDNIQNVRVCYHIFDYIDVVEKCLKDNISELIELLHQYGKDIKLPLDFQLISFEIIELKLRLEVLEKNSQVHIIFEEGKQSQLSFEIS